VAGVGCSGNDLGVDGRRGHAREQNRRAPGQPGELGRQLDRAVGQLHRGGRIARPRRRDLGLGADGEQVALSGAGGGGNDADAQSADHGGGQARDGVAGPEVDDPLGAGVVQPLDLGDPVDGAHEDRLGHLVCHRGVDAALLCPAVDDLHAVGQPRGVEADLDLHRVELGAEHRAAAQLVLALGLFLLGDLAAVELEAAKLFRRAGDDHRAPAVADRQHGRQHGAHVGGEFLEQRGHAVWVDVRHRHHRRLVAPADHAAATGHQ
jgi:hypothetical protein